MLVRTDIERTVMQICHYPLAHHGERRFAILVHALDAPLIACGVLVLFSLPLAIRAASFGIGSVKARVALEHP